APGAHLGVVFGVVGEPHARKRVEPRALFRHAGGVRRHASLDDVSHEREVLVDCAEVATSSLYEGMGELGLEDVMPLFCDAVLMSLAWLDPAGLESVVVEDVPEPLVEGASAGLPERVRGRRQVVLAHYGGHTAEGPQGPLKATDQRLECLTQGDLHPAPSAVPKHEVEQQVGEEVACDGHPELRAVGEVDG